jgi:hypothetical protein
VKIIQRKARDIKPGETVLDRSTRFIIKEVRVSAENGLIALIDMEGVWHGVYHPEEYLGVGDYPLAELSVTDFPEALQAAFEWVMRSKPTGRDLQISSPAHWLPATGFCSSICFLKPSDADEYEPSAARETPTASR